MKTPNPFKLQPVFVAFTESGAIDDCDRDYAQLYTRLKRKCALVIVQMVVEPRAGIVVVPRATPERTE